MGQPQDKAWAQRQVQEQGGRPHRMTVYCLLLGQDGDAWKAMTREQQERALTPFLADGEYVRIMPSNGEAFIVSGDPKPNNGRTAASDFTLDELKAAAQARAHWAGVSAKMRREAYAEAYAQATLDMAPKYVELERKVLDRGLADDATPAERRMAMAAWKEWKHQHMGKPVAPTEDVTTRPSEIAEWMSSEAPKHLPLSADWTVESVAKEQLLELEAGTLEGGE